MEYGINFFPTVQLSQNSGEQYYDEALRLSVAADELGFSHVRTVEHYFQPYGGMMPSPIVFLTMVAARTKHIRLVTGAVLPIFHHPIQLAGELAMLDSISHGRLSVGFARAFLPEEFDAFERSLDESRERYEKGLEAVIRLWTEDNVSHQDRFYKFGPISMMPRPVQQPYPPVYVAAVGTPASFEWAGKQGHNMMVVPYLAKFEDLAANLKLYRDTFWASHPEKTLRPVQMSVHLHIAETDAAAEQEAREHLDQYVKVFHSSATAWNERKSDNYKGYEELAKQLAAMTFERTVGENRALIGSPETVAKQVSCLAEWFGEIEPSLSTMYGNMPYEMSERSLRLFAQEVMPREVQ